VAKKKARLESPRTQRRAIARSEQSLVRDRERLFLLEAGGSEARAIEVPSASVVEAHALGVRCPQCQGPHEVLEHAAVVAEGGARLRRVQLRCRQCGSERALFFRLWEPKPN
jgi:uncharacterized protein with PIN domain